MAQFARPNSDDSIGAYVDQDTGTTNIYQSIDEDAASESDADFIQSENDPSASVYRAGLSAITDPATAASHTLRIRMAKGQTGGGGPKQLDVTVTLKELTTSRASNTFTNVGTGFSVQSFTLAEGEANAIGNYGNLLVEISANAHSGAKTTWLEVSRFEFETPDAPAGVGIPLVIHHRKLASAQ